MLKDTTCYYTEWKKEFVENNLRHIDFGDDHELQEKYDNLPERFKVCVNNTLDALTGGYDNIGYNLNTILEITYNMNELKISLNDICYFLYEIKEKYWDKELLDLLNRAFKKISQKTGKSIKQIDDEFAILARRAILAKIKDCMSKSTSLNTSQTITQNAISEIKKSHFNPVVSEELVNAFIKAIPNYTFLKIICESLFYDMDVLLYGVGRHYILNDDLYDFTYDDFQCEIHDSEFVNYCEQRAAYTLQKQAEAYESYLLKRDELEDGIPVLGEEWFMLGPSGKYLMLKKKKMPNGEMKNVHQDAIRALIDTLSVQAEHYK